MGGGEHHLEKNTGETNEAEADKSPKSDFLHPRVVKEVVVIFQSFLDCGKLPMS